MFTVTKEQQKCINYAITGKDLKIKAFAGAGKTSTLVSIANALSNKRGLYLAYNRSIADEAKSKFPPNVQCKTAHSLAYCQYAHLIKHRVDGFKQQDLVEHVMFDGLYECTKDEIAGEAFDLITKKFLHRDYPVSYLKPVYDDNQRFYKSIEEQQEVEIERRIKEVAYGYWSAWSKYGAELPISHDFYLKLYQLSSPNLSVAYDFIMFDECQDANPVVTDILLRQTCQKISVGDEHQQIYGWRGAVNAFKHLEGKTLHLSQSFRFGAEVADIANKILTIKNETKTLKGFKKIQTNVCRHIPETYKDRHVILCKTNSAIVKEIFNNLDKRIHVIGGGHKVKILLAESACFLFEGAINKVKHPALKKFKSWEAMLEVQEEARELEQEEADITFAINFIDTYKKDLKTALYNLKNAKYVDEKDAELVLSTIHKAKGREWDNVILPNGFYISDKTSDEEWNLLYVAITRAQKNLYIEPSIEQQIEQFYNN
jgi:hypothetical protein